MAPGWQARHDIWPCIDDVGCDSPTGAMNINKNTDRGANTVTDLATRVTESNGNNNKLETSSTSDSKTEIPTPPPSPPLPPPPDPPESYCLPNARFNLPKAIEAQLDGSFHGTPLPASLSNPPTIPTPRTSLLDGKIRWEGSWHGGWEPRWGPIQPDTEKIGKVIQPFLRFCGLDPPEIGIHPFRQGMWNKLYRITSKDMATGALTERIFRIPLPVNPWYKMQSEVATMEYVRQNTSIPIPKLYVFESSMENELGFEWMIMEKVGGHAYGDVKDTIGLPGKEKLYRTIAGWVNELSALEFDAIGSLYREWDPTKPNHLDFSLGPVTLDCFLGPWRAERDVFKGPFRDEAELYRSVVLLNLQDVLDPRHKERAELTWTQEAKERRERHKAGERQEVEEGGCFYTSSHGNGPHVAGANNSSNSHASPEKLDASLPSTVYSEAAAFDATREACFTLLAALPLVERRLGEVPPRKYILHHSDISTRNVLLNDTGDAIALLDWENLATESLSQVSPWPAIIDPERYEPPEPWQGNEPEPSWHLSAAQDYENRLAADAFMLHLKELRSPWPQGELEVFDQNPSDGLEDELAELGTVAKEIYSRWGETEACDLAREGYGNVFQHVAARVPRGGAGRKQTLPKCLERWRKATVVPQVPGMMAEVSKVSQVSRTMAEEDKVPKVPGSMAKVSQVPRTKKAEGNVAQVPDVRAEERASGARRSLLDSLHGSPMHGLPTPSPLVQCRFKS